MAGWELLDGEERHTERVMLGVRMATGLPRAELGPQERDAAARLVADGLLRDTGATWVLTDRGRLLADAVVRELLVS